MGNLLLADAAWLPTFFDALRGATSVKSWIGYAAAAGTVPDILVGLRCRGLFILAQLKRCASLVPRRDVDAVEFLDGKGSCRSELRSSLRRDGQYFGRPWG